MIDVRILARPGSSTALSMPLQPSAQQGAPRRVANAFMQLPRRFPRHNPHHNPQAQIRTLPIGHALVRMLHTRARARTCYQQHQQLLVLVLVLVLPRRHHPPILLLRRRQLLLRALEQRRHAAHAGGQALVRGQGSAGLRQRRLGCGGEVAGSGFAGLLGFAAEGPPPGAGWRGEVAVSVLGCSRAEGGLEGGAGGRGRG